MIAATTWRRFYVFKRKYSVAVRNMQFARTDKLLAHRKVTTRDEVIAALNAWEDAKRNLDSLDIVGYTAREMCDAAAIEEGAERFFSVAFQKCPEFNPELGEAWKQARADGTMKRRLVTDGYVKTGRYRKIDGVKIPIVERV